MADTYILNAEPREVTGRQVRKLRAEGRVPAVLYGHNLKPQQLQLQRGELERVYRQAGASSVVEIKMPDGKHTALIHQVQLHPVTGHFLHADLYQVRMDEKVKTTIPLTFENTETAPAVRELDGVLLTNLTELEIEALPGDLPQEISVDVEGLATFEDAITVADLKVPPGVTILNEAEANVASVAPPRTQEELEELEETPEEAEEPEVVGEGEEGEGEEGEAAEGEEGEAGDKEAGDKKDQPEAKADDKKDKG